MTIRNRIEKLEEQRAIGRDRYVVWDAPLSSDEAAMLETGEGFTVTTAGMSIDQWVKTFAPTGTLQ